MIADWVHHELENWARWCWAGQWPHPLPPDRAASAEGRHIPESVLGVEVEQDEQASRPPRPIAERAEKVHAVYRLQLNRDEQRILVYEYVHRADRDPEDPGSQDSRRRRKARKLRMSLRTYEIVLLAAAGKVGRAFT